MYGVAAKIKDKFTPVEVRVIFESRPEIAGFLNITEKYRDHEWWQSLKHEHELQK